jgi:predicted CopG family antitoxin
MIRAQIQLEEETYTRVKEMASVMHCSFSEVVRRSLSGTLSQNQTVNSWKKSSSIIGKYRSGLGDLSQNHDRYLTDEW